MLDEGASLEVRRTVLLLTNSPNPPILPYAGRVELHGIRTEAAPESDGESIRRAIELSPHDHVAIVRDTRGLPSSWLSEAVELLEGPISAAVVFGVEGRQGEELVAAPGSAYVFRLDTLRGVGGFWWSFDAGGLEEDAQWRLVSRGYRVHRIAIQDATPRALSTRTRLALLANNLEQESLEAVLPSLVIAAVTTPLRAGGVDTSILDLERSPGGDDVGTHAVPPAALAGVRDVDAFVRNLSSVSATRRETQQARRESDRALAPAVSAFIDECWAAVGGNRELLEIAFPPVLPAQVRLRALVVGPNVPVSQGGIEDWQTRIAGVIAQDVEVRHFAAATGEVHDWVDGLWEPRSSTTTHLSSWADLAIFEGVYLRSVPWLSAGLVPILVDCSHWSFEEDLKREHSGLTDRPDDHGVHTHLITETLARADRVISADERQRDLLLGMLAGIKRITPLVYDEDHSLRALVETVDDELEIFRDWCRAPRRAVDLVRSFGRSLPGPDGNGLTARARSLVDRARGSGE